MKDIDVRTAMRLRLEAEFAHDPTTRIVEEMGIWSGSVRIDIAVINGELSGIELKSDRDTLERLPFQADVYSRVFDRVDLVVGSKHRQGASKMVPPWWGIVLAQQVKGIVALRRLRASKRNPNPEPLLIARLLWKSEALEVLSAHGMDKGWRSKSADAIHAHLARELPLKKLRHHVRCALKKREGWLRQQ